MRSAMPIRGVLSGLAAALLFGASAPIAKRLLPDLGPLVLAALLYLGGGLALSIARKRAGAEARLRREDVPALLAIVLLGGVLGPLLMLFGLGRTTGLAASLLLNLEAPFTIGVAVVLFGEHLARRQALGAALIIAGATVLAYRPGELGGDLLGVVSIAAACLAWAIDNNLTQKLTVRDPAAVVRIKTLGAGSLMLAAALVLGHRMPAMKVAGAALVLGSFSYGLSILLDAYALRLVGAAREAALFATAPFAGALLAVPLLGERPGAQHAIAALAMLLGVAALLTGKHGHTHTHEALEHDHLHTHDDPHHAHVHDPPAAGAHTHVHRHDPITHEHPHVSDVHHRHKH